MFWEDWWFFKVVLYNILLTVITVISHGCDDASNPWQLNCLFSHLTIQWIPFTKLQWKKWRMMVHGNVSLLRHMICVLNAHRNYSSSLFNIKIWTCWQWIKTCRQIITLFLCLYIADCALDTTNWSLVCKQATFSHNWPSIGPIQPTMAPCQLQCNHMWHIYKVSSIKAFTVWCQGCILACIGTKPS